MAPPAVYRVPRRFITFPEDPPPYGSLVTSLFGHVLVFGAAVVASSLLGSQLDASRVYVVNLVPETPSLGSPAPPAPRPTVRPREPEPRPAPRPRRVEEKAPPRPEEKPPPPRVEEKPPPPRPARVEPPPPPKREPAPRPERAVEPPPAPATEIARPRPLEPSELALPRRAEKEPAALQPPGARERLTARSLPPPPPVAPATPPVATPRLPDPPRVANPPAAPAAPPAPAATAARSPVEPIRLGRPNAPATSTGSIAIDASDFPFTYYLRLIQSKIGERWSPPRAAAAGGERVIVLFEIQRDGQIREPTVERSSGNNLYDQAAIRAVTEASPLPPLPPEFKASSLRVHFGFEFSPDQG